MPPRFVYWTIILEGQPTAFRAATEEELLPTLKQLQSKHPDAVMKWFAKGTLWNSPDEARLAAIAKARAYRERGRGWRPGGTHEDPRAKFQVPRDEKRRRFAAKLRRDERPPRPEGDREARPPKPFGDRNARPPKPFGDRVARPPKPFGDRVARPPKPFGDRGTRPPKPFGDRDSRPPKPFNDRGPRSPKPDGDRGPRPPRPSGGRPPFKRGGGSGGGGRGGAGGGGRRS